MTVRDLKAALKAAGGTRQLASLLGLTQRTLQRWLRDGLPTSGKGLERFEQAEKERRNAKAIAREERQIFQALYREAGELGRLPRGLSAVRERTGPRTFGVRYTVGLNRMVGPALVTKVRAWASGIKSRPMLNVWQGQLTTTQYALPAAAVDTNAPPRPRASFRGYQTVKTVEQMSSPESGEFGVGLVQATPRANTKGQALSLLVQILNDLAVAYELMVFVHSATLFNYRFRTEQERKQWETQERNKRRKKQKRRNKVSKSSKKTLKKTQHSKPKSKASSTHSTVKKNTSHRKKP